MYRRLIAPQPFPDEFIAGHISRIMRINQLDNPWDLERELPTPAGCVGLSAHGNLGAAAAELCGMRHEEYLAQHGLSQIIFGCQTREPSTSVVLGLTPYLFNPYVPAAARPLRLCPACRQEDLTQYDCAYWHRSHQVPGMDYCHRHDEPLVLFKRSTILSHPNPATITGSTAPESVLKAARATLLVGYRNLCVDLLKRPQPPTRGALSNLLQRLGQEQSLPETMYWPFASKVFENRLPKEWLTHHFSGKERKPLAADWHNCAYLLQLCSLALYSIAVLDSLFPKQPRIDLSNRDYASN